MTAHTDPAHGTITIAADGSFAYTPAAGYTGADAFTYSATDTIGATAVGQVSITVKPQVTTPNQAFTKAAYQDFLHRAPTSTELSTTSAALDAGTKTRGDVVTGLSKSTEWVSAIVNQLYINTLGRAGEAGGVTYWTNELITGHKTVAEVSAGFYASAEYFDGIGGGTNATWITDLYTKLLNRSADASGISYWSGETVKFGRTNVAFRFFQAPESCARRVTDLYQVLLARAPDAAGRDYWAAKVKDSGDIVLAAFLAESTEYFNRAISRYP